jgi:hypothetical protein
MEPMPHRGLTVLANRRADYKTALPAWYFNDDANFFRKYIFDHQELEKAKIIIFKDL